jgi:hypothetical protein
MMPDDFDGEQQEKDDQLEEEELQLFSSELKM